MPKFRKKPVVIEAEQWLKHGDNPAVFPYDNYYQDKYCPECSLVFREHGQVKTLEGNHIVCPGDWIITGVKGEMYPCKPDVFEMTYEKV